ncbi:hydrogen gas-evolving membrane-bound hydrogenase subunit E [Nocardiopsis composta]|uniref:Multicomponent Na+:H+ antiporter subunit A n=1 Tax=Nocardiopsis composta TaxID=157465 RepID=A0A7W8QT25_9ACTN|nr:hydrogen gas-evolving membrane-bound hydrogenase subunit E [Nocardiopsis composta]MBB5435423.1 multicomponent Na+:H+ antiporter subunit A [Nocardiopsis composta]
MLLPVILALHAAAAVLLPPLVRVLGARAFLVASLPPALSAAWVLAQSPGIVAGRPTESSVPWVPALDITLDFRVDALSLAMVLLVSGVGAVIFCYSAAYFRSDQAGLARLTSIMVLFSGAMLGVVTADNLFALYVFWELTSVTSFLLVGFDQRKDAAGRAALQALITTAGAGLFMLIGFILLGQAGGTYRISELLADPPVDSPLLPVALVLVLIGAFAKSAQAPLHYWLPGAMVAPTPVSAYLHAAAMVKGGVYLIARLAPGFADVDPWRALVLGFGLATMVIGGWHALRQTDLKLLVAHGTVSQLGFLCLLAGAGTHTAAMAMVGALLAHGFFKSTLFLVVGVVDHQAGTRDIRRLNGLWRSMPVTAAAAGLAAASMAGLPPLLGFVGKEAALEAFLPGHVPELPPLAAGAELAGLVLASVLTFAYSARFWWGAFGDKRPHETDIEPVAEKGADGEGTEPRIPRTPVTPPSAAFLAAPVLLSLGGLVLGALPGIADAVAAAYAQPYPDHGKPYHLALWHGLSTPLLLTVLVIAAGAALFRWRDAFARFQDRAPRVISAEMGYHLFLHGTYTVALSVTRRLQTGSLPAYLGIILATMLALPGVRLVAALVSGEVAVPSEGDGLRLWDSPLEGVVAVVIAVTAIAALREHRRFPALILLSATGFGIAGLFVLHGAPDLALTLILVETLTTIILVFVLRRLPATFSVRAPGWPKRWMVVLSAAAGTFISVSLWLMAGARTAEPISLGYEAAAEQAGGRNLVNTILADFRALDTFGEVVVLLTAAVAVASLVLLNRRHRVVDEPSADEEELEEEGSRR